MKTLHNHWALVTGSSRGIGRQIALGLAQRGCNLIVHGRKPGNTDETLRLLGAYPVQTRSVHADLADPLAVEDLIRQVQAGEGQVDILYNNAGIKNPRQPMEKHTPQTWQEVFQVNLWALIALCTAFAPGMRERGYGRIVNISTGMHENPGMAPYCVSKAAVDRYSINLASELKGSNVLVNYVNPGWIRTDMGGPAATNPPESVLPGALIPALLDDFGPSGQLFIAQDLRNEVI